MITSVTDFREQISCILPGQTQKALGKEKDEDKMVEILIRILISKKHLAEGFYNVFISMNKDQAANIVYEAMKQGCLLKDQPPIQESQSQDVSGKQVKIVTISEKSISVIPALQNQPYI